MLHHYKVRRSIDQVRHSSSVIEAKMYLLAVVVLVLAADSLGQRAETQQCGVQKMRARPLMVRGYDAYPGQFPWHVAIFLEGQCICGGSLVSEDFVLTAAHCVQAVSLRDLKVMVGLYNLKDFGKDSERYSVYEVHTVPLEKPWDILKNDIALLELGRSVEFSDYIQPICLNSKQESDQEVGMVPGWGKTESKMSSQILQTASLPIIGRKACLASNRDFFETHLDSGMICAGHQNGTSVCNGDSGGGLAVRRCSVGKCFWFLVGVVSFSEDDGKGFCQSYGYGVFVKVRTYLPWISEITGIEYEDDQPENECGQRQDETPRARWPWHGTLYRYNAINSKYNFVTEVCGVTILTNQIVITTLRCANSYQEAPASYRVRFGVQAIGQYDQYTQHLTVGAVYTTEQEFDVERHIAVFKLIGHIQFTKYVQPICLWPRHKAPPKAGYLVSYGKYRFGDQPQANTMQIVSKRDCVQNNEYFARRYIDSLTFCAGSRNEAGLNVADHGTGLFVRRGDSWFLRGLMIAAVIEGPMKTDNVMFLDVTHFSDWISSKLSPKSPNQKLDFSLNGNLF